MKENYKEALHQSCIDRMNRIKSTIVDRTFPSDCRFKDLSGMQIRKLHVDYYYGRSKSGIKYFMCTCDCGNNILISSGHLLSKNGTISCGCTIYDEEHKNIQRENNITHNMSKTRLHRLWRGFRNRCNNPNNKDYYKYGGRGIKVCDEWNDFMNFYHWAYEEANPPYTKYYEEHPEVYISVDRVDNDKGYSPDNCRFASMRIQDNNKPNNIYIQYRNYVYSAGIWSMITGIHVTIIARRFKYGWPAYDALTVPPGINRRTIYSDERIKIDLSIMESFKEYNKYNEFIIKGKANPYHEKIDNNNIITIDDTKLFMT